MGHQATLDTGLSMSRLMIGFSKFLVSQICSMVSPKPASLKSQLGSTVTPEVARVLVLPVDLLGCRVS